MKKRILIGALIALVILVGIFFYMKRTPEKITVSTVKIGYQPTALYLPLFVALEKGYFEEHGLKVEPIKFGSANLMMQGLLSRQIDATGMSSLTVLATVEQQKSQQFKLYLFEALTKEHFPDYILVRRNSDIDSISQLKGKKIGVFPGSTIMTYTKIIFRNFMDPEKDIDIIQLEPKIQIQALEAGQIDALFTLEPLATIAIEKGIGKVLEEAPLEKYIMDPLLAGSGIFSTEFVKRYPNITRRVRDAIYKGLDFIRENPLEAKNILPKYTPIDKEIASKIRLISWRKISEVDREAVQMLIDLYYNEGVIAKAINLDHAYITEEDLR